MCTHHACHSRRRFLIGAAAAGLLAACGSGSEGGGALVPLEIDRSTSCALDGMILADYPGPKVQMHYAGRTEPDWFCDTIEMFSIHLNPEQARVVRAIYVQDMGKADWDNPQGHWIDARTAFYVFGSSRLGGMGPTAASFSSEADARAFAEQYGGRVLRFNEVTADMVVLDGGALHDQRM
ncbi:nitrous oxide reductase accessory protein NosL [Thauera sp.]|uniref:nitrous oxide reductase accessory protein NosL n=1 Tax=Thauera sp. TaxID=1905334 RepID=UPI002CEB4530|nr:nitrous oxide reductase accessory protein NosL [Thauera sp.]HRP25238.1 nitrous oxide reductase accessory protein NosL [Thauera sp.]